MRQRIIATARRQFSQAGFDHVGLRDIAGAAETDAAIVIRLFGSKEALFEVVAAGAFDLEADFDGPAAGLGERIARHLVGPAKAVGDGFDAFQFLLRSAPSPLAAPILSRHLQACFMEPLAAVVGGREAEIGAVLATASILGFSTLRFALAPAMLQRAEPGALAQALGHLIQSAIDGIPG